MTLAALDAHARRLAGADMRTLIAEPGRDDALVLEAAGLVFDARRQRLDLQAWKALLNTAQDARLPEAFAAMARGDVINTTESRPVLHMACRNPDRLADPALASRLRGARERTAAFADAIGAPDALAGHPVRRIVNIGIGGSDLGPRFIYDALKAWRREGVEARFVSNLDPADLDDALEGAEPETTLVVIVSKSFTTQETLMNGQAARGWLAARLGEKGADARLCAATAAPDKAAEFGVDPARIFPFEGGVGGRYSLWSPAGIAIELAVGAKVYARLLHGARVMDDDALETPLATNLAAAKGLVDAWNRAVRGLPSRCVAAYSSRLERLPAYLQQLEMESLGKSAAHDGAALPPRHSGALVWGGRGSDLQHSVFQWLHQGQDEAPVDFIALNDSSFMEDPRARALNANLAAQGAALTTGRAGEGELAAHKAIAGGRASSTILMPGLTPESLGALVALHEHKVFAESVLYGLNAFDQWGVELGKALARDLLSGDMSGFDPAARDLARRLGL
ncbi:glucose-6-phosphate isomerase [Alkalicaulis satelles]|uniref:Glucose-6-phosphate isomerase n=1 Tax=Alkalicaulis satelles TaxID=2609175 RepID=A0A5M6ZC90_9PROT|nr:glucose-6-phosphate isomerase [Alkalicaulis satelles]KAA5802339.1 glucose-6-phosphate isomerase [Alkalicaulis satelles]